MDRPVRRDDLAPGTIGRPIAEVTDATPGFFDDQKSGCNVPGMELEFPVGVESPSSDITQVEGSAAIATNSARSLDDVAEALEIVVFAAMDVIGKPGGDQ